jgi:IS5 family transposase
VIAAPANRRDDGLLAETLDTMQALDPLPDQPTVHLDAGYDYQPCRTNWRAVAWPARSRLAGCGMPAPVKVGRRWVVERSHAWLNAFGKLRWCTERRRACVVFWLALACVIVIIRRLVRRAWTHYRWDGRPHRRP